MAQSLRTLLRESTGRFAATGRYQGIEHLELKARDPIRMEIFHSRLLAAVLSARDTAKRVSASPMTREFGELSFALFTPEGDAVAFSMGIMVHIRVMGRFIKWLIENDYEDDPGIHEGDHFACNDVLISAVHVPDLYFVTPIVHEGQIVGWAGGVTHNLEVGGVTPGGMSPLAVERYLEGIHISAEKVADRDHLHRDYELRIRNNTRQPLYWLLDDRARIAGNVLIRREVLAVIAEFGLDYYLQGTAELIEDGRRIHVARVRQRLVPGRLRAPGFYNILMQGKPGIPPQADQDSIIHLPVEVSVQASGQIRLSLDGASAWGYHAFNAAPGSVDGGLAVALTQVMDFDERVNEGAMLDVELELPRGSVVNPDKKFVSTSIAWVPVIMCFGQFFKSISRAFFARGFREEVFNAGGRTPSVEIGGINQFGQYTGGLNAEVTGSASGARGVADGLDAAYALWNPEGDIGNCEMWEMVFPVLYMGRSIIPDSPGPGKYRGGCAMESMFMVWRSNFTVFTSLGNMTRTIGNEGLCGGYPAPAGYVNLARDTDLAARIADGQPLPHREGDPEQPEIAQLQGRIDLHRDGFTFSGPMKEYDLFEKFYHGGGGGYGDPLERQPHLVLRDLDAGIVTAGAADRIYGVVAASDPATATHRLDTAATERRRAEIRAQRLARARPVPDWWQEERAQVVRRDFIPPLRRMYAQSFALSSRFAAEFRSFWQLPSTFTIPGEAQK